MRQAAAYFEKNSFRLLIFTLVSSLCNYLFQITAGNLLPEADYGTVNALLSLSVIVSAPTAIFMVISSKYTTSYLTAGQPERAAKWIAELEKAALICAAASLLVGIALSGQIAEVFHIENRWYAFSAFGIAAVSYCNSPVLGALQGSKRFVRYGMNSLIMSGVKLFGSVALILLGMRILGAVYAIVIGTIIATIYSAAGLADILKLRRASGPLILESGVKRYIAGVLLVQFCNAVLSNGDMLLVKVYAKVSAEVGVYSSAMVIGKIPLYIAGALVAVLFPMVSEAAAQNKAPKKLLLRSMLYGGGIAVVFALFLQLFGTFALKLMFGERYLSALPLLLPLSVFIFFVTLITIEMNYFLALGRNWFLVGSLLIGFTAVYFLISAFHQSIPQMIYVISGVLAIVFAVNTLYALLMKLPRNPIETGVPAVVLRTETDSNQD